MRFQITRKSACLLFGRISINFYDLLELQIRFDWNATKVWEIFLKTVEFNAAFEEKLGSKCRLTELIAVQ